MFKVKEGINLGGKVITATGPTAAVTVSDVGNMAFQNSEAINVGSITMSAVTSGLLKSSSGTVAAATAADVTGQLLTGFTSAAGTISASDTILQAINKLDANVSAGSSLGKAYFMGSM
jgi:hypothetical protein